MSSGEIERRIFVVGAPRSGTTLVQSLLAAHSRVTSFTESHFFDRHFLRLPGGSAAILTRDPTARVREFLVENGIESAGPLAEAFRRAVPAAPFRPLGTGAVARRFLALLDGVALESGESTWVEKTPRHLRYAPFLERVSGSERPTRFVHVVREGLEVVASLHAASRDWERSYDLPTCAKRWNGDVAFSLGRISAPSDRFVLYEALTERPEETLERLFTSLELEWEPQVLERFADVSERLVTEEESWKAGVARDLSPSRTSERELTKEQRERVSRALHHDLYERLRERLA